MQGASLIVSSKILDNLSVGKLWGLTQKTSQLGRMGLAASAALALFSLPIKAQTPDEVILGNSTSPFQDITTLVISNSPETFCTPGIFFDRTFSGNSFLNIHHVYDVKEKEKHKKHGSFIVTARLINPTKDPITIRLTGKAMQDYDPQKAGTDTATYLYKRLSREEYKLITIPPGGSFNLCCREVQLGEAVSANYVVKDLKGTLRLQVKAERFYQNARFHSPSKVSAVPPDSHHPSGIFFQPYVKEVMSFSIGSQRPVETRFGTEAHNPVYGVTFHLLVHFHNPTKFEGEGMVKIGARGGSLQFSCFSSCWNNSEQHKQKKVVTTPIMHSYGSWLITKVKLKPGEDCFVEIETTGTNGANYPASMRADGKVLPPSDKQLATSQNITLR